MTATASKRSRTSASPAVPTIEPLIPIRLDLNLDGHRVQETFTWNASETQITPVSFARHLSHDLHLPDTVRDAIAESIQEQILAFVPPQRAKHRAGESRQIVRLDLRIGRVVIRDQFEWDLNAPHNSPESFAEQLCADLGLNTEHVPAVAHAIREQLVELAEFQDKRPRCPVLQAADVLRPIDATDAWEPAVECLTLEEQERLERKEKREARLQRRNRGKAEVYGRAPARKRASVDHSSSRRRSSAGY